MHTQYTPLLITGCYRSGTTLLEKVLNMHPQVAIASQPFPVLYSYVKEKFLNKNKISLRYPLDHLFLNTSYSENDFHNFLTQFHLNQKDIANFFDLMDEYKQGLWTPEVRMVRNKLKPGTFWSIYLQLMNFIRDIFPRLNIHYGGTKEVLIEEYASYFIKMGSFVIISIRDPRALIASLNFRERENLTGKNRPVLFSMRAWRKSVAIAHSLHCNRKALILRHEDFVLQPVNSFNSLSKALGISLIDEKFMKRDIVDQYGNLWFGNSSFGEMKGINNRSLDVWKKKVPDQVIKYIETICMPEMKLLGYEPCLCNGIDFEIIRSYRDPFDEIHPKFPQDYSHNPKNVQEEIDRISNIFKALSVEDQRKWYINVSTFLSLKQVMST